jgi:hypothetical protein
MVNNVQQDGRQLFLTANHCTNGDNSYDMVRFNYQATGCDGRTIPSTKQTAQGLKLIAKYALSDFAVFEVEEAIPEDYRVYLSGWSAVTDQAPRTPVGIHHPSADIKKISFCDQNASESCWGDRCSARQPPTHWRINKWGRGTTEPGSSGSPLFDAQSKRVVGQLHGGSASCYNMDGFDLYGKVAVSFVNGLNKALDPEGSGQLFVDGMELNRQKPAILQFQA